MSQINKKIKEMRQSHQLTLSEVAKFLGVKEATVQRYESGNIKNIKFDTIRKLANLFHCDPCYLMGWESSTNGGEPFPKLSDQAAELLRVFESLDVRGQTELLTSAFELEKTHKNKNCPLVGGL